MHPTSIKLGDDARFYATFRVGPKRLKELKIEGGVNMQTKFTKVYHNIPAGKVVEVSFTAKALWTQFDAWFKVVPNTPLRPSKWNRFLKTSMTVKTQQVNAVDAECAKYEHYKFSLAVQNIRLVNVQANTHATIAYDVQNKNGRCIKKLRINMMEGWANGNHWRMHSHWYHDADLPGGWALKGNERKMFMTTISKEGIISEVCPDNREKICSFIKLDAAEDGAYRSGTVVQTIFMLIWGWGRG